MLDPRRLRLLVELADRGTIAAVADALHFAPSTVSHGLATLEREVGVALLERTPRSVRLTPAAETLVREGRAALARLQAAAADAGAVGRLDGGEIVIASFPSAGATLGASALRRLREQRPHVAVRLREAEPEHSLPALIAGEADVAVTYAYPHLPPVELDGVEFVHLLDDPIRLLLAADDRLAGEAAVALSALKKRAFVAGGQHSACAAFARAACRAAGFEPHIAFETEDITFTSALVATGAAVAILPELLIATAGGDMCVRELEPAVPPRTIWAAHRTSASGLPAVRAALDALTQSVDSVAPVLL